MTDQGRQADHVSKPMGESPKRPGGMGSVACPGRLEMPGLRPRFHHRGATPALHRALAAAMLKPQCPDGCPAKKSIRGP